MADNADQIAEWNGAMGERWAQMQADLDLLTRPFGDAALAAAKIAPGERVIDIGCGCGDTTFSIAQAVGPGGSVVGLDISRPMLHVAGARLAAEGPEHLSFGYADAANDMLPGDQDVLFSRFGVMFFDDPTAAFVHMRQALKPTGRMAFCCWRTPQENPWMTAPLIAARQALGIEAPAADPYAPGPFAFADAERLRGILESAGFTDIEIKAFDHDVRLGENPRDAAENSVRFGPSARFIRDIGEHAVAIVVPPMAAVLEKFVKADGSVAAPGANWIVTGRVG